MAGFRKRRTDEAASFDSLLDTMTNVVGILIVVLVITQLGVARAVKRIESNLPPVTPEELASARQQRETSAAEMAALRRDASALKAPDPAELAALKKQIEDLRRKLSIDPAKQKELEALRKRVEELDRKKQDTTKKKDDASKQHKDLETKLEKTPDREPLPSFTIPMPDPRPAPPGLAPVVALCRYNRVAVVDPVALRTLAFDRLRSGRTWVVADGASPKEQGRNKEDPLLCDPVKLQAFFAQQNIGTPDFRLDCRVVPADRIRNLKVELRPNGGESANQIRLPSSRFNLEARRLVGKKNYLSFVVWPDSFEVYIEARKLCDRAGIAAGWEVTLSTHWETSMDPLVKIKGEAPPPKPPPPGTPVTPSKPRNVLD